MIGIEVFRENPEEIKESEKRRDKDPEKVEKVIELDEAWRESLQKLQDLQEKRNKVGDRIAELKKDGKDAQDHIDRMQDVKARVEELEQEVERLKQERDKLRYQVGNILHESVPKGDGEEDNVELRTWSPESGRDEDAELAADILEENDLIETEKAAEQAGERAYYLKNDLFRLNQALIRFSMDLLREKGYTPMQTPYMLKHDHMEAAAELEDFEEQLYGIEDQDKYLIATSEQTLATLHRNDILQPQRLPKRYAGFSTNFRREAGKHGTQTRGIWRIHQFEKVEQYIFCEPEDSWSLHEELIQNSEEVMQKLGLPYRVVNVCTGDMNDNAAKKYAIEVWRPPLGENETAHTLNATACATERVMTAIVENNQTEKGIKIPEPLQEYMGQEYIEIKD